MKNSANSLPILELRMRFPTNRGLAAELAADSKFSTSAHENEANIRLCNRVHMEPAHEKQAHFVQQVLFMKSLNVIVSHSTACGAFHGASGGISLPMSSSVRKKLFTSISTNGFQKCGKSSAGYK